MEWPKDQYLKACWAMIVNGLSGREAPKEAIVPAELDYMNGIESYNSLIELEAHLFFAG